MGNFVITDEKLQEIGKELLREYIYTAEDFYAEVGVQSNGEPYNYIDFMDMHRGNVETLELTRKGYEEFEKVCEKEDYNRDYGNFSVSVSYDVSGYDYWTLNMRESNYANLSVELKNELTQADKELIREISRKLSCDLDIRGSEYVLSDELYQQRLDGEYNE